MHEAVSRVPRLGVALHHAHPEWLEPRRVAIANYAVVRRAFCPRRAIDLRIGQPSVRGHDRCTPTAGGTDRRETAGNRRLRWFLGAGTRRALGRC
jgi:hypothetical protein